MEGYVRNTSNTWRHAFKRSIGPGQKIELDVLYEAYGEKHDIEPGQPFAVWLREVKIKDAGTWEISYTPEATTESAPEKVAEEVTEEVEKEAEVVVPEQEKVDNVAPFVMNPENEIMDIVNLSVRKAREIVPNLSDSALVKNAHAVCRTQSNKDTLTNMLKKRMDELKRAGGR